MRLLLLQSEEKMNKQVTELAPFRWTQFVSSRQQFEFQWSEIAKNDIMGGAIREATNCPSNLVDAFLEMMPGLLSHLVNGRRARQHMLLVLRWLRPEVRRQWLV